jgi:hypothetical protein
MSVFRTISMRAAVWSVAVMIACLAWSGSSAAGTGSIDIYGTDFQRTFPTRNASAQGRRGPVTTGSIDIYATDFQKVFTSDPATRRKASSPAAARGSIDIYSINFQAAFL